MAADPRCDLPETEGGIPALPVETRPETNPTPVSAELPRHPHATSTHPEPAPLGGGSAPALWGTVPSDSRHTRSSSTHSCSAHSYSAHSCSAHIGTALPD